MIKIASLVIVILPFAFGYGIPDQHTAQQHQQSQQISQQQRNKTVGFPSQNIQYLQNQVCPTSTVVQRFTETQYRYQYQTHYSSSSTTIISTLYKTFSTTIVQSSYITKTNYQTEYITKTNYKTSTIVDVPTLVQPTHFSVISTLNHFETEIELENTFITTSAPQYTATSTITATEYSTVTLPCVQPKVPTL